MHVCTQRSFMQLTTAVNCYASPASRRPAFRARAQGALPANVAEQDARLLPKR